MSKDPCVYIMASRRNGTLYTGVTSDLARRADEHRCGAVPGFTRQYGCKLLVWYERLPTMAEAIAREKQIKAGSRDAKLALIESLNPAWVDLYDGLARGTPGLLRFARNDGRTATRLPKTDRVLCLSQSEEGDVVIASEAKQSRDDFGR